jgi:type II secretory pathway component PulC
MAGLATPPGGDPTPWRLALSPLREKGRLVGWRLSSLAGLPALARAGLKPGDVLLSANGAELISEEKVMELPQELAANGRLQVAYRRGNAQREAVVTP